MSVSASKSIPWLPRSLLTTIEPLMALAGALTMLFSPTTYLSGSTRGLLDPSSFDTRTQFIYTGQAGSWVCFAFNEFFVLRATDELRMWRLLCAGMLCSDVLYCHSVAQAVGGWGIWVDVTQWTVEDWVVTITTWPFVLSRVAIVMGLWGTGGKGVKVA